MFKWENSQPYFTTRNIKKPGSCFQNLNKAGSFRDHCLSIAAKIMQISLGRRLELSVTSYAKMQN